MNVMPALPSVNLLAPAARRRRRSQAACGVLVALLCGAPAARADELVATLAAPAPISAFDGRLAWSAFDTATGRYRLMTAADGTGTRGPVRPRAVPFDVDLGPGPNGDVQAVYSRCRREPGPQALRNAIVQMPGWSTGRGCDLYRFAFDTGREHRIAVANSASASEFLPTIWKQHVAFARVYKHSRPYLYWRRLDDAGPSRRLPAGARSSYRVCSPPPAGCETQRLIVEPGPTALDLRGTRLAFGWDSGHSSGPTSAAYLDTIRRQSISRRLLQRRGSGSLQGKEIVTPVLSAGSVLWGSITFGEDQGNELRRLTLTTGALSSAALPAPSQRDGSPRPVLAIARNGRQIAYLLSGHAETGEPGCTPPEPCTLRIAQDLAFTPEQHMTDRHTAKLGA
jgi:hypothetical protein